MAESTFDIPEALSSIEVNKAADEAIMKLRATFERKKLTFEEIRNLREQTQFFKLQINQAKTASYNLMCEKIFLLELKEHNELVAILERETEALKGGGKDGKK